MSRLREKTTATLLIAIFMISTCAILPAFAATEEEIEASIALGLSWLASQQNPDGSWGSYQNIAKTGLAVLKLIDYVKEVPGIDSWTDPDYVYHSNVSAGLDFIFREGYYVNISAQTYGDPDTLVNGKGIRFYGFDDYETSIALMALGATMTPGLTVNTPGLPLDGVTYADVVQDVVDYLSYNQRESTYARGGWGYQGSANWADNSVSGYASLGLGYAQAFGATIPQFVKDELAHWITIITSPTGYSYYRPPAVWQDPYGDLLLRTGNLLYEMALVGMPVDHPNVTASLTYIENNWALGGNTYQRAYCLMKGLEAYGIEDEINVGASGDWFNETSTFIVNNQNKTDGSWPRGSWDGDYPYTMTAAWALLTLEKAVAVPLLTVSIDIKPGSWPNPINKDQNGVTSIAICGTEDFDVMTIDPASVMLYTETSEVGVPPLRWSYEDVATPYPANPDDPEGHDENSDGYIDLVLKYDTQEYVVTLELCEIPDWEPVKLYLKGNLIEEEGGTPIEGFDWVRIQSSKGKGKK